MQATNPQLSIIVEWENVKLSEMDRCREMLRVMAKQIPEYFDKFPVAVSDESVPAAEILILYDAGAFDGSYIEDIVSTELPRTTRHCEWRISPAGGEGYFGVKNMGAFQAKGETVLFIDSDLIPEAGWLEAMLTPLTDPEVQVVAGHAYVTPDDFLSRVFALVWFFPLRAEEIKLAPTKGFFANGVAFRRSTFLQYPFEPIPGTSRGACRLLAKRLDRAGVKMVLNTAAQAGHPPPNGLKVFLLRGVAQGRDELLMNRTTERAGKATIFHSISRIWRWHYKACRNILFSHRRVGMPFWQLPGAFLIAGTFGFLLIFGDIATRLFPETMKANFHL